MKTALQLLVALAVFCVSACDDFAQPIDEQEDPFFRSPQDGYQLEATVLLNGHVADLNQYGALGWQCTGGWWTASEGYHWACYRGHAGSAKFEYLWDSWSHALFPNGVDELQIEDRMDDGYAPIGCVDTNDSWVCAYARKIGSTYIPPTVFASISTESGLNYQGDNGRLMTATWPKYSSQRWSGQQWYSTTFDYDLYQWWVPSATHIAWKWTHEGRALFGCYPRGGSRFDCAFVRAD